MTLIAMTLAAVLAQAGAPATEPAKAPPAEPATAPAAEPGQTSADRAAEAAQKAAEAAQKAAEAAMRVVEAMTPKAEAKAEEKKEAEAPDWVGNVGLGLTFITGNSQTLTLTGSASADHTWDRWSLGLRLSGAYGLANPDTNLASNTAATTARRANGSVRGDRSFGAGFASLFLLAGSEFDHMKNIESRSIGELGTGLTFLNQKDGELEKVYLRLDVAARAGYETRFQYFPVPGSVKDYGIVILAPRIAATFRWNFSKDVRFSEELEFIPFLLAPTSGRLLINNTTKLNARLTESLSMSTAVVVNFDSMPPEGSTGLKRKETDVALTVGLEAAF